MISQYLKDIRTKIGHDMLFTPTVSAVVINQDGEVLLQKRRYSGKWGLPSGLIDPGEQPSSTIIRELQEEAAIDITPVHIVGIFTGSDYFIEFPHGDQIMCLDITFLCHLKNGQPKVNDAESIAISFFDLQQLPEMDKIHTQRLELAISGAIAHFEPAPI